MPKCLYCYKETSAGNDFHTKCSKSFFGTSTPPVIPYKQSEMAELAKNVVERSISVPGVQPKLSMSILKETVTTTQRLTVVGALGGQYIFKPPSENFNELPANEHLTMKMAESYGIKVVPSSLIKLATGELSYITKRIDRDKLGAKIHMLDMFQITEAFDKYRSSMEKVGKALNSYSSNTLLDKVFFFEITVFCFLTGNNDMHLKNFSMIEAATGWTLAPAYDLLNVSIVLDDDPEEFALTLLGKKRKIERKHFNDFGQKLELTEKQIEGVFKRMFKYKSKAYDLIENSFLSKKMKHAYKNLMNERYNRLV